MMLASTTNPLLIGLRAALRKGATFDDIRRVTTGTMTAFPGVYDFHKWWGQGTNENEAHFEAVFSRMPKVDWKAWRR